MSKTMAYPITLDALSELEDQSAELGRCHAGKEGTRFYQAQQALMGRLLNEHRALLASARELLEIKSALGFLARSDIALIGKPFSVESIIALVTGLGWTSHLQASEVPDGAG